MPFNFLCSVRLSLFLSLYICGRWWSRAGRTRCFECAATLGRGAARSSLSAHSIRRRPSRWSAHRVRSITISISRSRECGGKCRFLSPAQNWLTLNALLCKLWFGQLLIQLLERVSTCVRARKREFYLASFVLPLALLLPLLIHLKRVLCAAFKALWNCVLSKK